MIHSSFWKKLRAYMPAAGMPGKFPADTVALFAPRDDVVGALQTLVASAAVSIKVEMFTYCDKQLHALLVAKAPMVQATFDESQYLQIAVMKQLVDELAAAGADVATGKSEHGEIIHRKVLIVDHLYVANGSTNWTISGEKLEDNDLVIRRDAPLAAWYEQVLDVNHARVKARKPKAA